MGCPGFQPGMQSRVHIADQQTRHGYYPGLLAQYSIAGVVSKEP